MKKERRDEGGCLLRSQLNKQPLSNTSIITIYHTTRFWENPEPFLFLDSNDE